MTVEIIETIEQVEPDEWDQLVNDRPFANWAWLQMTEAVLLDHEPRYVLLRKDGILLAGAVCGLQKHFQSSLFQATLGWYIHRFPGLRCSIPISYDPSLLLCSGDSSGNLWGELMDGVQQLLQQEHVSFYTIDHLSPDEPTWQLLQEQGYHRIDHLAETYLDIHWTTFDNYIASLTKKKRKEYRRIQGHLERNRIVIDEASLQNTDPQVLEYLINNVFERHKEPIMYPHNVFQVACNLLGDDFRLIVARQEERVIGCVALLRSGTEWILKWPGLDYERTLNTGTYYGLIAESIRLSIEASGTRVRMGATAYMTKQHFGVTFEPKIGALAFRNRLVHFLAGKALQVTTRLNLPWPIVEAKEQKGNKESE